MGDLSIVDVRDYTSFKQAFRLELTKASQSFVRIGYLLKRARDEDTLLKDSGYSDVNDFAKSEFGLDKSQVSRFMRINDRFSIGGYSEHLMEKYENFGSSKLSLMLLLPDEINEELTPEYSKSDINAIKSEWEAEQKISDLEVLMEEKDGPDEFLAAVVKELNDEHPDEVAYFHETLRMAEKLNVEPSVEDVKEAFMPDGDRTYNIRISGQGRFMVNMKADGINVVSMRDTTQKSPVSWEEFWKALKVDMATRDFTVKEEKPKKPKRVEPARPKENKYVKEVREFHEREDAAPVQETAETLKAEPIINVKMGEQIEEQCKDNVPQKDPEKPAEETDTAAGPEETMTAAGEEITSVKQLQKAAGEEKQLTWLQKQTIEQLDLIKSIVVNMDDTEENWKKTAEMLKAAASKINEYRL